MAVDQDAPRDRRLPAVPAARSAPPGGDLRLVRDVLGTVRRHLDMDVAYVVEFTDDHAAIRFLDGDLDGRLRVGDRQPLDDPAHLALRDGAGPVVAPDVTRHHTLSTSYVVRDLSAGAFVGVALHDGDPASSHGALCCASLGRDLRLRRRDVDVVRMVGNLVADHLRSLRDRSASYRETARVIAPRLRDVVVVFQPIIDLDRQVLVGHEALARFPGNPRWPTETWFEAARSIGYGVELEVSAVRSALAAWPLLPERGYLSLNVSPAALCSPELRAELGDAPLTDLVFEITEHEDYVATTTLIACIDQWRAAGARIAVDDAGSGYSGLRQVLHIAPDVLKLDRSLVVGACDDPARQALTQALAWFAQRTGADLVAEGIETRRDLETLHAMGVRYGQGYYLGTPQPAEARR